MTVLAGSMYGRTVNEERQAVRVYLDVLDAKLEKAKKLNQHAKVNILHAQKVIALTLVDEEPIEYRSEAVPATVVLVTQPPVTLPAPMLPVTTVLYWVIIGLAVGSLTNFIVTGSRRYTASSVFLGIIGAVAGGFLGEMYFVFGVSGYNISSFILAIAGSVLAVLIDRLIRPRIFD
jgi:uncharacterized membrane protein YeaQ/YmgE (transglycosylase-associated protein family)